MSDWIAPGFARRVASNRLTRRDVLWRFGAGAAASALSGCATSPVDGSSILVGMSEAQERQIDRQVAPHQFSQDMGPATWTVPRGCVRSSLRSTPASRARPRWRRSGCPRRNSSLPLPSMPRRETTPPTC